MAALRLVLFVSALVVLAATSPINSFKDEIDFRDGEIHFNPLRSNAPKSVLKFHGLKFDPAFGDCQGENKGYICIKSRDIDLKITKMGACEGFEIRSVEPVDEDFWLSVEMNYTGHLYGGPEQYNQQWPLDDAKFHDYSMVTKQQDNQGIADGYWLNSQGYFFYFHPETSLFIDQNYEYDHFIKFTAKNKAPYPSPNILVMKYDFCIFEDAREAHSFAVNNYLGKPTGYPDERMITHPVWSTWARYKSNINEDIVSKFANEILEHGFNNSQLEIDDLWERCYGSLEFDTKRFPDMKGLSEKLKKQGFRVTLWVHPFINVDCDPFYTEAKNKGFLVKNEAGETESNWWNGRAGVVDFTNGEAVTWWTGRLRDMMEKNGIDSFKFDAGETSWMPQIPVLNADPDLQPTSFTIKYVDAVSQFGSMIEVRVGHHTQQHSVFVRMLDKDTRWGMNNGLQTLITTLLEMNLVGYPLVLPDMVGGNGYGEAIDEELFLRWLQANVFMPSIQFSYVPWDFNDEQVVTISKKFTKLHSDYAAPILIELMKKAVVDGTPVNLPVWWIDPLDEIAQEIKDEFLLGENILVAPVVEKGAVSRDVYLPRGTWRDMNNPDGEFIKGPYLIREYPAPLDVLPYFEKVK